jgi:hypothetical protein
MLGNVGLKWWCLSSHLIGGMGYCICGVGVALMMIPFAVEIQLIDDPVQQVHIREGVRTLGHHVPDKLVPKSAALVNQ